jgi:hypothetical protein
MSDASTKLEALRTRKIALEAEETALLAARLMELAALIDQAGGATLTDEILVGAVRTAIDGNDEMRAEFARFGGAFLRPVHVKRARKSRAMAGPLGSAPGTSANMVAASANEATALQNGGGHDRI